MLLALTARLAASQISQLETPQLARFAAARVHTIASAAAPVQAIQRPPVDPPLPHTPSVPLNTGRPRLVILGSGWGAARLTKDVDCKLYDITVVSPRNHMVFTPLLASACVGTIEPRSTAIQVVDIQRHLRDPQNFFFAAKARQVDTREQWVTAQDLKGHCFRVHYDKLAICTGSQGSTFGIKGVEQHAHFLREVSHAREIRDALLSNWNLANIPGRQREERLRLLHTIVVGGGPTGVEFAGELMDWIQTDLKKVDADRVKDMRVTIVEANEVLGTFDTRMRSYAADRLQKQGINVIQGVVKDIGPSSMELSSGDKLDYGLCVWSTGVGPTEFTTALPFAKTAKGRLAVNEHMQILVHPDQASAEGDPTHPAQVAMDTDEHPVGATHEHLRPLQNVHALGDCCANIGQPLPALAQVAEQQGKWLAKRLNQLAAAPAGISLPAQAFEYRSMGSMATVGSSAAVLQGPPSKGGQTPRFSFAGFSAWLAWKAAYFTRLASMRNRIYLFTNWTTTRIFGRDMSRF